MAQILQKQWAANLGAEVSLVMTEWTVWVQSILSVSYRGMIESGLGADYPDPNSFFENFTGRGDGSGWSDPEFGRLLDHANAEGYNTARMRKLAVCEERILRAMPVLPMFFDAYSYLEKPYVRGMTRNALDTPSFKDVWIDTSWRPS
jgi:oligopeptide transport system substrate-binding protein